jgi:hypothetical protein
VSSLATSLGIAYYHPVKGAIRPYSSLSVNLLFNDYSANWYTVTDTYAGTAPKTSLDVAIIHLSRKNMGMQMTAGILYRNRFFAELRYLNTDGPSNLGLLFSRRQSLALALGYQL